MLAKVWKKVLLAICIVACIYNVMSKIVNRHSLEENLKSANDGETVFDFSKKEEVSENVVEQNNISETSSKSIIDNSLSEENSDTQENSSNSFFNPFSNLDFLFQNTWNVKNNMLSYKRLFLKCWKEVNLHE